MTALAIILVITAFILIGLNALQLQQGGSVLQTPNQSQLDAKYREGYLAARQKYQMLCPQLAQAQKNFSGKITAISGNTVTVDAANLDSDMIVDNLGSTRTINLVASTKIQRTTQKDQAEITKEMDAYSQTAPSPTNPPPQLYNVTDLSASDLNVGEVVSVTTVEDARSSEQLTAVAVNVQ